MSALGYTRGRADIDDISTLLELLAAGDRLALARVTRVITGRLRRLGAYDLGDEWHDLCQEVVWALVRAVRAGRAPDKDKEIAYIASVVHNRFTSWLRRRGSRPTCVGNLEDGGLAIEEIVTADEIERAAVCEERLAAKLALARLPRQEQALLVAHYVEGRTIDVLVVMSGESRATVNRRLRRAREAFRTQLVGADEDAQDAEDSNDTLQTAANRTGTR